jgi:hypothetical protein
MKQSIITLTTILAAGLAAFAQTHRPDQILQVARATWPGVHRVGIVCSYAQSSETIHAMMDAFAPGSAVKVIDVRPGWDMDKACTILANLSPQYVLLLPNDPVIRDGSAEATKVITRMNQLNIPTLASTPIALSQGAWAAKGPATGNLLQVNSSLKGYLEAFGAPIDPIRPFAKIRDDQPKATLSVIAAF